MTISDYSYLESDISACHNHVVVLDNDVGGKPAGDLLAHVAIHVVVADVKAELHAVPHVDLARVGSSLPVNLGYGQIFTLFYLSKVIKPLITNDAQQIVWTVKIPHLSIEHPVGGDVGDHVVGLALDGHVEAGAHLVAVGAPRQEVGVVDVPQGGAAVMAQPADPRPRGAKVVSVTPEKERERKMEKGGERGR